MSGINLFEQQAHLQRQFHAARETPLLATLRFIEGANMAQCSKLAIHLSARLFALEKRCGGMQAANLNEAAHLVADAVRDIEGAMEEESAAPCRCGRCDDCVAARSDERHDRRRDARAA